MRSLYRSPLLLLCSYRAQAIVCAIVPSQNGFAYVSGSPQILEYNIFQHTLSRTCCRRAPFDLGVNLWRWGGSKVYPKNPTPMLSLCLHPLNSYVHPLSSWSSPLYSNIRPRRLPYTSGCLIYPNDGLPLASPLTSIFPFACGSHALRLMRVWLPSFRDGSIPYYRSLVDAVMGRDLGRV